MRKIENLRDNKEDEQKDMPEEDFENKKLLPILKEAYDLVITLEKRKETAEKEIKRV